MFASGLSKQIVANHFFRDLAEGIQQQMYFWGHDVLRPEGNFFLQQGFQKSPSKGLKGTSCYRKAWQNGHIELYGSCAGWYGADSSFAFIRPKRRCMVWLSAQETPLPGAWQEELMKKKAGKNELYYASLPFLDWLLAYEHSVLAHFGAAYRVQNYTEYKKVPKAKAWIKPDKALRWFKCFLETPEQLVRPRQFSQESYE